MTMRVLPVALSALTLMAVSSPAFAIHARPGEWQVNVTVNMAGMPKIPPEQLAKMHAMGIHLPTAGDTVTTTHCMTPEEASMDHIPAMTKEHQKYCTLQNMKNSADSMSADMVCTGKVHGTGHMSVRFDSPQHYIGNVSMQVDVNGHPTTSTTAFEAKWVSADCKADR